MKHLGDITKINGAKIPVVDIVTGGSPCQDLSVAGKRAGLQHSDLGDEETTRSGLFMDQLRIVKEMRESDRRKGRNGVDVRPRYMVWENVPGAFSSNGGKDFQAVLTEIARIVEPNCPDVPMPERGGWPKAGCIYGEMGNWSIAYRVHDAQYWGVPQRRKRIALIADFNGLSAPEILFDPQLRGETPDSEPDEAERNSGTERGREIQSLSEGLPGYFEPGGEAGKGTAEGSSGRSDGAISFQERAGRPGGAKESLSRMSGSEPCQPSTTNPSSPKPYGFSSFDSNAMKSPNPHSGIYEADTSRTLDLNGGSPACNQGGVAVVAAVDCRNGTENPFCERDSASEGAGAESQQQQRCESPEPKFFQNTGVGWWNEGNAAETIRTPGGATQQKQTLSCANPYDPQSERVYHGDGAFHSLSSNSGGGRAGTPSSQAVDLYNQTIDGEIAASVTAAAGGANTSGPKVLWGGFKPRQSAKARTLGFAVEQAPTISTDENYAVCWSNRD